MSPVASLLFTLATCYLVLIVFSGGGREMIRSIAYHPWSAIAHGAANAFPTFRWRGPFRMVGLPVAWAFAGFVLFVFAIFALGVELLFSPRTIWCSFRRPVKEPK